jgi:hypothetical protein
MVLYYTQKDDDSIFRNNQDMGIRLPQHMSYVKRTHLLAFPVELIFCGLPPFYEIGAKIVILAGHTLLIQDNGTCRKSSVLSRAHFKM